MTMPQCLVNATLLVVALGAHDWAHSASADEPVGCAETRRMSMGDEFFAKGGLGIVNAEVYIDLRSRSNELVLKNGTRWTGREREAAQLLILWKNMPVAEGEIPADFELTKSILVSFERARVTFVDFQAGRSGFYTRRPEP